MDYLVNDKSNEPMDIHEGSVIKGGQNPPTPTSARPSPPQGSGGTSLEIQHGGNHYKSMPVQPVEYCQKNKLNFCESCAIKYATRHKEKGGSEDLKKAIHFLQMALEMEYQIKSKVKYSDE